MTMKTVAIVPAAGKGKRLSGYLEKPFIKICADPLLLHTLRALNASRDIQVIILVVSGKNVKKCKALVKRYAIHKVAHIVKGGSERGLSVRNGLRFVDKDAELVLVHDGARPCLDKVLITRAVNGARRYGASCVCVPIKSTVKAAKYGFISKTLKRCDLWEAQTPQVFRKDIIIEAYNRAADLRSATDDACLVEKSGYKVRVIPGDYDNLKVTTKEDLVIAEEVLKRKGGRCVSE